ncbi:unnamed protein product [Schistosoma margrebowiei]|uniref:PiggyBac transposable element-derived protein 4 C-terminal zinc-finger domain-containing protein n=1 Tax=Schistosoma margrebowiei TaxID=48269 RepID=A0A183LM20_9TREM|nr:unnamed protein product [Schistosoma margrebowiei]
MRFIDLNSAFKMTCELQQRVVDLIYSHKKHLRTLEAIVRIKQEGCKTDNVMSLYPFAIKFLYQFASTLCSDHIVFFTESTVPVNNDELPSNNSQEDQPMCNTENTNKEAINKVSANNQTNIISDALTTNSIKDACGATNDKHRLVSIESLYHDMLPGAFDNSSTNENVQCNACQLRNQVQNGMTINMVCAACPGFPRICSAQCFRWWHSVHLLTPVDKESKSIEEDKTSTIENLSRSLSPSEFQQSRRTKEYKAHTRSLPLLSASGDLKPDGRKKKRKSHRFTHIKRHPPQGTSFWVKQSNNINPITVQPKAGRSRKTQVYMNIKDPEWTPYRKY